MFSSNRSRHLYRFTQGVAALANNMGQDYNRLWRRNTTLSLVLRGGSGLYADLAFGAIKQAGDVLAVHEPKRRGQKKKERRDMRPTESPEAERCEGARDQRGKR